MIDYIYWLFIVRWSEMLLFRVECLDLFFLFWYLIFHVAQQWQHLLEVLINLMFPIRFNNTKTITISAAYITQICIRFLTIKFYFPSRVFLTIYHRSIKFQLFFNTFISYEVFWSQFEQSTALWAKYFYVFFWIQRFSSFCTAFQA